jgi:hypothetical protein
VENSKLKNTKQIPNHNLQILPLVKKEGNPLPFDAVLKINAVMGLSPFDKGGIEGGFSS